MKVAFDSRPCKDERGIGRYARSLLAALREAGDDELVETHDPRRCDLFHTPWLEGAIVRCPVPMVVSLRDLIALKRPGEYLRTGVRYKLRYLAAQRAARVIVPTAAVADDAQELLHITPDRITVIPEASAPAFRPRSANEVAAVRERYDLPEEYLLWVGSLRQPDPRKRVAALARAHRAMPLVLVGPAGPWAGELAGVQLAGAVADDDLAAIYTGAHALVFPSDDEGFGLPPIEALACGTPVAACAIPALQEVLAGRAELVDPADLDELVRTAESLQRPAPPAPGWTWGDAARATTQVYAEAVAAPALRREPTALRRSTALRPAGVAPSRRRPML